MLKYTEAIHIVFKTEITGMEASLQQLKVALPTSLRKTDTNISYSLAANWQWSKGHWFNGQAQRKQLEAYRRLLSSC